MGGGSAEGYYAGSMYTGIGLVVIAVLNMIIYIMAVRRRSVPRFLVSHIHSPAPTDQHGRHTQCRVRASLLAI